MDENTINLNRLSIALDKLLKGLWNMNINEEGYHVTRLEIQKEIENLLIYSVMNEKVLLTRMYCIGRQLA